MNKSRTPLLTSLALGLMSLTVALWGGIHLQHLINSGGGRHVVEAVVLIVLALGLFAGSVCASQRGRKAG